MKPWLLLPLVFLIGCKETAKPMDPKLHGEWAIVDAFSAAGWSIVFESDNSFTGYLIDFNKDPHRETEVFSGWYSTPSPNVIQMRFRKRNSGLIDRSKKSPFSYEISPHNTGTDDEPNWQDYLKCDAFPGCGESYWLARIGEKKGDE